MSPKVETSNLLEVLETDLGTIYIYDHIVMMEAKENVLISFKTGIFILLKVIAKVGTRPVVYISNRINSYAVDPNDYKYLEMLPTLKGIAIVSYSTFTNETSKLEQRFFSKPFRTIGSVPEAKEWAEALLDHQITLYN